MGHSSASEPETSAPGSTVTDGYRPQLDGLRCLAVAGVLVEHFWRPAIVDGPWFRTGLLGVKLFFVLSGFLITGILLDARDEAERSGARRIGVLARFYGRRALRIFPLYYAVVAAGLLLDIPFARNAAPWLATYTSNFYEAATQQSIGYFMHFWTLATEEQFYLVWPWLVLFLPRRWLAVSMLSTLLIAAAYRELVIDVWNTDMGWFYLPFGSIDALGLGGVVAFAVRQPGGDAKTCRALGLALPVAIALYVCSRGWMLHTGTERIAATLFDLSVATACAWAVLGAARGFAGVAGAMLQSRVITYLGRISYGIYAIHTPLHYCLRRVAGAFDVPLPQQGPVLFMIAGGLTVLLAMISWRLMESPINRFKRHLQYLPSAG